MLKEAIQYLVGLNENRTYEINGITYSDRQLHRIDPAIVKPSAVRLSSLDGIVKLIENEADIHKHPIYIRIDSPTHISVFTGILDDMERCTICVSENNDVNFEPGWCRHQEAIIALRSRFIPTDDTSYLLDLLSRMSTDSEVTSVDNGVTQTVTARQGVSLKENVTVKPIVSLRPFRTFREVPQPESEFLLRVDDNNRVGLFEADGGIWKMEAKIAIANYFRDHIASYLLGDEDHAATVVIME